MAVMDYTAVRETGFPTLKVDPAGEGSFFKGWFRVRCTCSFQGLYPTATEASEAARQHGLAEHFGGFFLYHPPAPGPKPQVVEVGPEDIDD